MKKIALVLTVLLVLGGAAFAEVTVGGDATVSGSVSTSFGYDLQNSVWGLNGASSITLTVPFANGSAGASGDDDLYGEITVSGIAVNLSGTEWDADNTDGTIAAKIVAGDIYVGLNSADFYFNNAVGSTDNDVNINDDVYAPFESGTGSLVFGYDDGAIAAALKFATKGGYDARSTGSAAEAAVAGTFWTGAADAVDAVDPANNEMDPNGVVLGIDLSYTSDAFSMPIYTTLDFAYADALLFGLSGAPSIAAGVVTVDVPFDVVVYDAAFGFDVAPAMSFAVMEGLDLGLAGYFFMHDPDTYLEGSLTAGITMVDNLDVALEVGLTDILGTLGYSVDLGLGYVLAEGLSTQIDASFDGTDFGLAAGLAFGAAFTGIDNTSINLDYSDAVFGGTTDAGVVSLGATVSF